jgi:TadE-like protein
VRNHRGQAATETIIMMMFLLLMIFGLIHLCMLMTVKYMVNLSAFAAARSALVDDGMVNVTSGATEGLGYMNGWWSGSNTGLNIPYVQSTSKTIRGKTRGGYSSTFAVPFGLPIFNTTQPCGFTNAQTCGVRLIGFSAYPGGQSADGDAISHDGDNGDNGTSGGSS